jgi:hypothetical protein
MADLSAAGVGNSRTSERHCVADSDPDTSGYGERMVMTRVKVIVVSAASDPKNC